MPHLLVEVREQREGTGHLFPIIPRKNIYMNTMREKGNEKLKELRNPF